METTILAAVVSFVLTLLIGRFLIPELRKLKAGQEDSGSTVPPGTPGKRELPPWAALCLSSVPV